MSFPRFCFVLAALAGVIVNAQAEVPAQEQSCAAYLGIEPGDSVSTADEQKKSAAYLLGKQLGNAMRQRVLANWVQGYLIGYAAAKGDAKSPPDIESLKTLLQTHCTAHTDQTLQQAAEALR